MIRALAIGALAIGYGAVQAADPVLVDVRQGTDLRLTVSSDGTTLVTDLLGQLWSLPAAGGAATPLTPADEQARAPRFSPDDRYVVYQRRIDNRWDIWQLDLDARTTKALTGPPYSEHSPAYADAGQSIVFSSNRTGTEQLWRLSLTNGALTQLTFGGAATDPAISDFGDLAYVERQGARWSLRLLPPGRADSVELDRSDHLLAAPSWRPGGGVLVYHEVEPGESSALKMLVLTEQPVAKTLTQWEDVFLGPVAWVAPDTYLYAADGQIWQRGLALTARYPVQIFAAVAVTPTTPGPPPADFYGVGPHPARGISRLASSPDEREHVFSALGDIWLSTQQGALRQLTDDAYLELDPSFAEDGDAVVFASDRGGSLQLWRVSLADNAFTALTSGPGSAYFPTVSPGGRHVAFLRTRSSGPWGQAALELLDLGNNTRSTLATDLLAATRPTWSEDGSALSLEALAADGAAESRHSVEIATGLTAHGRWPASAGRPTGTRVNVPAPPKPELSWSRPGAANEPYVVQIGRLFDGIHNDYRHHMDVHIAQGRITSVVARGLEPLPRKVVDARDLTMVPGMIDLHVHQSSLAGERLGRCWLYYGITTVREISDDPIAATQRAEIWASGKSPGPRLVIAPSATTSDSQSDLPISRGKSVIAHATPYVLGLVPIAAGEPGSLPGLVDRDARNAPALGLRLSVLGLGYQDVTSALSSARTVVVPSLAALDPDTADWRAARAPCDIPTGSGHAAPPGFREGLGDTLRRLLAAGGYVGIGSDAPLTPYGAGFHAEMRHLSAAGVANDRLLRLATAEAALALGLDAELGTLEAGKLADFIVLAGDPLADLGALDHIVAVIKDGVWMDRAQLVAAGSVRPTILPGAKPAERP